MNRRTLTVLAFFALAAVCAPALAGATATTVRGKIALSAHVYGTSRVFTVTPDETHFRQITHDTSDAGDTPATARGRAGLATQPLKKPAINGPLTLIAWQGSDPALDNSIATVGSDGALTPLIRPKACCELESVDWAPGGRRLAFALGCVGCGPQAAPGIYVAVAATGSQRRILGGFEFDLDWSPDGSRLAYVRFRQSSNSQGSIYVVKTNGSHPRVIDTGTAGNDSSPSWSPNGARLAFASDQGGRSSVSVIDLDGSHRAVIAANGASAPAWSPNGQRIAVSACGGIKLFTPSGEDVTPANSSSGCRAIGVAGAPIWSPDGRQIAIKAKDGIYTMTANGADLKKVTADPGGGMFGTGKPTWRPIPRVRLLAEVARYAASCNSTCKFRPFGEIGVFSR